LNAASHTFTANGSFDFVATDAAGNITTKTVTITNIDKTLPVITLGTYDGSTPTKNDIVVTATTNKGTLNAASHTFTANGSFDFVATDTAGNVTTKTVTISNIDKVAPVITLGAYDGKTTTKNDIVVTATTNEGTLNAASHTFTANGSFDFVATDTAGNVTTKTVTITNIDKIAPVTTDTETIDNTTKYVTVNLNAYDAGSSAVTTYYSVDKEAPQTGNMVKLITEGIHFITYWSVDQAGNIENLKIKIVKVDLLSKNNIKQININDIVKLINQEDLNGKGGFYLDDIKVILGAITPIQN
jgi:hypothetical protein